MTAPALVPEANGTGRSLGDRVGTWGPPALVLVGALAVWQVLVIGLGIKQFIRSSSQPIARTTAGPTRAGRSIR